MNTPQTKRANELDDPGAHLVAGVLLVPVLVCLATIAVAWLTGGPSVAIIAGLAAISCLAGVAAGHVFSIIPRGDMFFSLRLMLSSTVRVALPLVTLLVCRLTRPELLERGMVYFVILFYLVGLMSELITRIKRLASLQNAKSVVGQSTKGSNHVNGTNGR